MKKYLIFASSYDENVGGTIVLHKLCSLLNELGYEAYLHPSFPTYEVNKNNYVGFIGGVVKRFLRHNPVPFKTNPAFKTSIYKAKINELSSDFVVVYPEVTFGNPLNAQNVVRWLLHYPGFITNKIYYGKGELYFDFNSFPKNFYFKGSEVSKKPLLITSFPFETYNLDGALAFHDREGTAYCLRKGKHQKIIHNLSGSILIDGKSHQEVASIFKRVKTFISYDNQTAYSGFAALCGADSVVILDKGITKEQLGLAVENCYGVAYGFEEVELARKSKGKLLEYLVKREAASKVQVQNFVDEVERYFGSPRGGPDIPGCN